MSNQDDITQLIRSISGQANTLTIPRIYVAFTKSHRAALFLNQCVYWSDRTRDPSGWFYKSFREWFDELGLNQHAVETCVKVNKKGGWLETKTGKVGIRDTTFYRPVMSAIAESIRATLAESAIAETAKVHKRKTLRSSIRSEITNISSPDGEVPNGNGQRREPSERDLVVARLEQEFSRLSGIAIPQRDTEGQKKAAAARWWNPLYTIYTDAAQRNCDRAVSLIEKAVTRMRKDHLTISAPKSVEQVAISIAAADKPKVIVVR